MAFKHYDVVRAASPSDLAKRITQKLNEPPRKSWRLNSLRKR
ncbi:DUF1737 domain-containing protein [Escherichia coli O157:H7]|nr:DUF1737 domain-containing protein [Escherichia coli]MDP7681165.1 DUF1737 domain-containing protein [Escherichia coli]QQK13057.1 DUF1737 domain-containing protein [Escherichia coli O157:H7]